VLNGNVRNWAIADFELGGRRLLAPATMKRWDGLRVQKGKERILSEWLIARRLRRHGNVRGKWSGRPKILAASFFLSCVAKCNFAGKCFPK
jgi:hypothetical protein